MNTKLLAVLVVGVAAVAAAGTGAYLAVRQNQAPAPVALEGPVPTATPAVEAVTETEGVLTPESEGAKPSAAVSTVPANPEARPRPGAKTSRVTAGASPRRPADPSPRPATRPASIPTTSADAAARIERAPEPPVIAPAPESPRIEPEVQTAPPLPPPPPEPQFEEVVLPSDSVIGLQIENSVSSETARIEDRVEARVTRDVRTGGVVAIPAGSKAQGSVTLVEKGGKVKERARLGIRFHTLVLADGTRVPIQTETILREGESPAGGSAAKIGGAAVGGAIIGAILGGGKGAAIGGSVGAAGGTAAVMAGSRAAATLNAGSTVTARLSSPASVTVEKKHDR